MAAKYPSVPITFPTHMVAVYIFVTDIITGHIGGSVYLRRRPFPFKLTYIPR
jgi:hypothetical protein